MKVMDESLTPNLEALRKALRAEHSHEVLSVLQPLSAHALSVLLNQAGFDVVVDPLNPRSRAQIFESVRADLAAAFDLGVDGFGLKSARSLSARTDSTLQDVSTANGAVAKVDAMVFKPTEFDGNFEAAKVIQKVMRSSSVEVSLLGDATPVERNALLMLAGQALKKSVQGFGVDGLPGKYELPLQLGDLMPIYKEAVSAVAQESARTALSRWANGLPLGPLDGWVPEATQRLLSSSVSLDAARAVVGSLESRSFEDHCAQIGAHGFTSLLQAQGLDVDTPTIAEQAKTLGLKIQEPNKTRGQYFGSIMGVDHRAGLVRVARSDALELPFKELQSDQPRPGLGDSVHMVFKNGNLAVSVTERASARSSIDR